MSNKILILSPHLDDAVFSCFNYIKSVKKKGNQVDLVTIFTKFGREKTGMEQKRKLEDKIALSYLKLTPRNMDFLDAAYRKKSANFFYRPRKKIFSSKIHMHEKLLLKKLKNELSKIEPHYDLVLTPLGVGNHVDHLMIKYCVENIFSTNKIGYYLDWPYAFSLSNWKWNYFQTFFKMKKNFYWTNGVKISAMKAYQSQFKVLFYKKPLFFPELILCPSKK